MTPRLTPTALRRHAAALVEVEGLAALGALAAMLDPDSTRSRWNVAQDIAARLTRFEGTAYKRIATGARQPKNITEALLVRIAESGLPRDPRNIWKLIC